MLYIIKTLYDQEVEKRATLNTKREDIIELLEDVGSISDSTKKLVEKEEDLEVLKKWHKIAARVNSIVGSVYSYNICNTS